MSILHCILYYMIPGCGNRISTATFGLNKWLLFMKQVVLFSFAILLGMVVRAQSPTVIKYVTQTGAGLKNGSSWANAWNDSLFAANLHLQPSGTQVWVAGGTYQSSYGMAGNLIAPPSYTFFIPNGVQLYGGFAGTEDSLQGRVQGLVHTTYKTILSGLLRTPDLFWSNRTDRVVTMGDCGRLDGFTISDGYAIGIRVNTTCQSSSWALINNCIIQNNGLLGGDNAIGGIDGFARIDVSNSYLVNNRGRLSGGITCTNGKLKLLNCVLAKNIGAVVNAVGPSSAIYFSQSNCTFVGNNTNPSSALFASQNASDSIYINNSIIWGNYELNGSPQYPSSPYHLYIVSGSNRFSVKNSLYQPIVLNQFGILANAEPAVLLNSTSSNPFLVNESNPAGTDNQWGTADDGLRLTPCSPVVNVGNNSYATGVSKDILGNNRLFGGQVDLGAYELQQATAPGISIQLQPTSTTVNFEQLAVFEVGATGNSIGYQWQRYVVDTGWVNLANNTVYSGVTTPQLLVNTLNGGQSGTKYRCLLNNAFCSGLQTQEALLTIRPHSIVTLCPGGGTMLSSFQSPVPLPIITQWYMDTGSTGYHIVLDGPHYSGSSTPTLQLINVPSAWYGRKYFFVLNGAVNSPLYVLKFANRWTGAVDNSWENPANWSCGQVPDANTDATIGTTTSGGSTGPSNVIVGANSICRTLTVLPGGNAITVLPGFTLTVVR
jgi:hypothetical protein